MPESLDRRSSPPDNPEVLKQKESQRESEKYLKLAQENPHAIIEEIKKNPKTEPFLRKLFGDAEYERIKALNPKSLAEDASIASIQKEIYSFVDINPDTDRNSSKNKFLKGFIDSVVIENAELAKQVIESKGKILLDMISQILSWEGLKQIAEGLRTSVMGIFSGDAYKFGKSTGELGLITIGSGAGGFLLKKAGKSAIKAAEGGIIRAGEKTVLTQTLAVGGKGVEALGKVVQAPYNGVKWAGGKFGEGISAGLEKTGVSGVVRSATEPVKKIVTEGIDRISPPVRKVMTDVMQRSKEVLAVAAMPLFVGSKDGRNTLGKIEGQIGAVGDIAKIKEGLRIVENPKKLYDHPDYAFLAGDEYKGLRELFPDLSEKDVIGEGLNGIILKHPDESKVIKIAKPKGDNLEKEFPNQRGFTKGLRDLKKQLQGTPDGDVLKKFNIPEIHKPKGAEGIYIMEKIDGINFKTLTTINHHQEALKDLPKDWYHGMTDKQIDDSLRQKGLKTYSRNTAEDDKMLENISDRHFLIDLEGEGTKLLRAEGVEKVVNLLKKNGYYHDDYHWGNAMITPEGKIYLIDFGRSRIPTEIKPNP